jgi:hypothetical protein
VDPGHLVLRHGEHAEGVLRAEVFLGGEGELAQVGELPEVRGVDGGLVELALVERNAAVRVGHRVLQAAELQRLELVAGDGFFAVQDGITGGGDGALCHLWSLVSTSWRP